MKTLKVIKEQDIVPSAPPVDRSEFQTRNVARAIVLNENNGVYLLKVSLHNYHKLPGGGVDRGEDIKSALARECMEEIGCEVDIIKDVGKIVEYLDGFRLIQTSYCFLAKHVGRQVASSLEKGEIAEGFVQVKAKNIDEAIRLLEQDQPDNYEGHFIKIRDTALLKAAKELLT